LPIKIAFCQKSHLKSPVKRISNQPRKFISKFVPRAPILFASEIRITVREIFIEEVCLTMRRRERENEGFRANDAALLLFMVVAVWLWAFFR
jgi:hypothetical protein